MKLCTWQEVGYLLSCSKFHGDQILYGRCRSIPYALFATWTYVRVPKFLSITKTITITCTYHLHLTKFSKHDIPFAFDSVLHNMDNNQDI